MRLRLAALTAVTALGGCAQPEPGVTLIRTLPIRDPVSIDMPPPEAAPPPVAAATPARRPRCSPALAGAAPSYADRDEALRDAPSIYEQVQMLLAGRRQRIERERQLAAALRDCAQPPG